MNEHSSTTYRPATSSDIDAIIDFQMKMASETEGLVLDANTLRAGVSRVVGDTTLGRYFVAEADGRAVGSLLITYEWSDWRNAMVWWIQSVYVVPELRRRGVYRGFYAFIRDLVTADPQITGIRLYVDKRNLPAQQAYSNLGMNGDHYQLFEWMKSF